MDDSPTGPAHKKRHHVFRCLKNALTRRSKDKDTPSASLASGTPAFTSPPGANSGPADPNTDGSKANDHDAKDHWQMAYDALSESDRNTLMTLPPAAAAKAKNASRSRTQEILDEVVKATEAQYKAEQRREGIRTTAHKIINSALSFQDVVNTAVRFDPTGYASSAWAIVSLGLTMAKNYAELRDALFDSSGYLADLLTRCAFIEEQFYGGSDPVRGNSEKERSIIRAYMAILQYSAEVRRVQQYGKGKDIVESITAGTSKQLAQLKASIKGEESHLHQWLLLDQHLHRKAEAEAILTQIDKLAIDIKKVHEAVAMLNLPFVDSALFDSFMDQNEEKCLPGTREELLQQVQDWGRLGDQGIFWLSGKAGTGKSTIARTVAGSFKADGVLGASFFFKRGRGDRSSAAKLFPTIAKQLVVHIPQMISGVQKAIDDDPTIGGKTLEEQFKKLILQPLLAVGQDEAVFSTVVVIDALDECEPKEDLKTILAFLAKVVTATDTAVRFFLTSRPEQPIRISFEQIGQRHYQHTPLHKVDDNMTRHDITLYLTQKFSQIQQTPEHDLPHGWPGEEQIETLAARAAPLFIFAATVCRFVADGNFDPNERLQEFLTNSSGSKLDDTYRPVLKQLLVKDKSDGEKLIAEFQKIIGVIILLANPLSLSALAELLELQERNVSIRLRSFHSVLVIPSDPNLPIQTFHSSFRDYLLDEGTKTDTEISPFWVDKGEKHELIGRQCLTVMGRYLKKNICGLPSYGTSRIEIDSDSIARSLPPALQYACRYWVYHFAQSSLSAKTIDQILPFLEEHFLHWLESMSIMGLIYESLDAADTLLKLTKNMSHSAVSFFLLDAHRFILKFLDVVDTAPLQLYSSGLIFAPQRSLIRTTFKRELPGWLFRSPRVDEEWISELRTLEGHFDRVQSVSFSPDGHLLLLASGSNDHTVKLWDPVAGVLKHTLEGHAGSVSSVAFSPCGDLIASGSLDCTIKLWDVTTAALGQSLEGHSHWVQSVAFSLDGHLLASGSDDYTIKLWDPATGVLKHTLYGHSGWVSSVAFSPDGHLLASSSGDHTIKLWDPVTGVLKNTLEGHADWVLSIAFSPTGSILVSSSADRVIILWDPATGACKHTLLGHSNHVQSVAFSADGHLLASGSDDRTIKLWDPSAVVLKNTLVGHSDRVQSVSFSPDGHLLASGSDDHTIKLWDPAAGALNHTINTGGNITNIEFSKSLPELITNLGSFTIQACYNSFSSNFSEVKTEVSLQASRWVAIHGKRELWLPADYQAICSTTRGGAIALGCLSGRVCIITFSLE
ncbi:hypothetical protein BJX68DRAFT_276940 [Aspergillus pseudodeflectus]|uniref:Nephrocystin 3-like N-terminal domain-containing protein n=1 Tax=Aspergillus pseudodeflectus TaxID=176178 RepID=A0ABR4K4V8_9EURO